MNWLDIVIIVLLFIPTFTGLRKGLIKTGLSLAGLLIGITLAGRLHSSLAETFTFTDNEGIANVLAFVLILAAVMVVAMIIAFLLRKLVNAITIGWLDHLGGALFGLFSGFIFIGAILAIIVKYLGSDLIMSSFIAQIMLDYFPIVLGLLPEDFNAIREFFQA